jgi:hypothetical protein
MVKGEALSVLAGHFFYFSNTNCPIKIFRLAAITVHAEFNPNEKPVVSTKGFCCFRPTTFLKGKTKFFLQYNI